MAARLMLAASDAYDYFGVGQLGYQLPPSLHAFRDALASTMAPDVGVFGDSWPVW